MQAKKYKEPIIIIKNLKNVISHERNWQIGIKYISFVRYLSTSYMWTEGKTWFFHN